MKYFKYVLLLLVLSVGVNGIAQDKKVLKTDKEIVTFDVNMTCENCQNKIEKNIAFEPGVTDLKVNLPEKTVKIEFKKDKTNVDKLKAAIEKLGYQAKVHENK